MQSNVEQPQQLDARVRADERRVQRPEWFEDAACTQRAAPFYRQRPPSHFALDLDGCAGTPNTIHPNQGISPSSVLYDLSPTCTLRGGTTGIINTLGAAVDAAVLTRRISSTGRRIEKILYDHDGFVGEAGFYDTMLSARCVPRPVDDVIECSPLAELTFEFFRDAACTMPVDLAKVETCMTPQLPGLVHSGGTLHELGPQYAGPVYTISAGCVLAASGFAYYKIGPVASLVLARGQLVTLP